MVSSIVSKALHYCVEIVSIPLQVVPHDSINTVRKSGRRSPSTQVVLPAPYPEVLSLTSLSNCVA
jgi:hypothetical protein